LRAYLKPTVRVRPEVIPLKIAGTSETCAETSEFVDLEWNSGSLVRQIQLIASFSNSAAALRTDQGEILPASEIEARINGGVWKRFPEARPHTTIAGLLLQTLEIADIGRRGTRHVAIEFRSCGNSPPDFPYEGAVAIQAILR
jgi:hypothetical protein